MQRKLLVQLLAALAGSFSAGGVLLYLWSRRRRRAARLAPDEQEEAVDVSVDVAIVGGGLAGAATAWHVLKDGNPLSVLVLEREVFPRPKLCAGMLSPSAQLELYRMGVMVDGEQGMVRRAEHVGFITPVGRCAVFSPGPDLTPIHVPRELLDQRVAKSAVQSGAILWDGCEVKHARRCRCEGWILSCQKRREKIRVYCRVLVCADGASSSMARNIGLCNALPNAAASLAQAVLPEAHSVLVDDIRIFTKDTVPGHVRLSRLSDTRLSVSLCLLPTSSCDLPPSARLYELHCKIVDSDPIVKRFLGPNAQLTPFHSAPLRVGSVKMSARDVLVVGDAAGLTDALTGDGIHTALVGARIAGSVLRRAFRDKSSFSAWRMTRYRWRVAYSMAGVRVGGYLSSLIGKWPKLLDAAADPALVQEHSMVFADILSGKTSRWWFFLRPDVGLSLIADVLSNVLFEGSSL